MVLLLVFLVINGCADDPAYLEPSSITIATYNVEDFNLANGSYAKVAAFTADKDVGVICLQEVQPGDHPNNPAEWNSPNNAGDDTAFAAALSAAGNPMPNRVFSADGGYTPLYGDYLAFFSRYPFTSTASILKGTYQDPVSGSWFSMSGLRPVLYVKTRFAGGVLHLFGIHLKAQIFPPDSYPDDFRKRRAQAHALEEYIKSNLDPEQDMIVILGDVNSALTATDGYSGDDFADESTLGILCLKSDNPGNPVNDFTPVNVALLAANAWTHSVYDSRLDHIILSPAALALYRPGSISIVAHPVNDPADHYPVILILDAP